ncbi:hypothetical protein C8R46DRAFT_1037836 [Mycena filopes]|nr:hypothetical protein C8R46DRAFT_1037829 [Mycena filopes]KAJ7161634.1 hypothetical protein C8R46DRAFT_1037836 [Mycena filopes]
MHHEAGRCGLNRGSRGVNKKKGSNYVQEVQADVVLSVARGKRSDFDSRCQFAAWQGHGSHLSKADRGRKSSPRLLSRVAGVHLVQLAIVVSSAEVRECRRGSSWVTRPAISWKGTFRLLSRLLQHFVALARSRLPITVDTSYAEASGPRCAKAWGTVLPGVRHLLELFAVRNIDLFILADSYRASGVGTEWYLGWVVPGRR